MKKEVLSANLANFKALNGWRCVSGGAQGADSIFSECFRNTMVISFDGHKVYGRYSVIQVFEKEMLEGLKEVARKIAVSLGRRLSSHWQYQTRDILQVKLSKNIKVDFVLAFADIESNRKDVASGTAYAVNVAQQLHIPIYLIDKKGDFFIYSHKESKFLNSTFDEIRSKIQEHASLGQTLFTGIGSREVEKSFTRLTIMKLFKK